MTTLTAQPASTTLTTPAQERLTAPRPDIPATLSDIARTILSKRYLLRDANGVPVETPEDMFWRVACRIADNEFRYGKDAGEVLATAEAFYRMMAQGLWVPNSPTLMNAGRPLGQLSACFVLPVDDELSNGQSGIYDTLRAMALVHQSGGGTGFSFSRLRPKDAVVRSTMGVASGPVSFMKLYDASTEVVKQGGTRRGANMAILRVDHPDIEDFLSAKEDLSQLTNFNISVAITDRFMEALAVDGEYEIRDPRTQRVLGTRSARAVFDRIVQNAWRTGEPGVFFIDRANYYNPVPSIGAYESTNPCGEQPLLPYDVCNLGSINLGKFVRPGAGDWRSRVDWDGIAMIANVSTRFLDNVIDVNNYPLPQIEQLAHRIRRIGNGPMGFADMLLRLGVPYGSPESVEVSREVAAFFDEACKAASESLAAERGVFPAWAESIWGPDETCARDASGQRIRPMRRLRNCNVNTVAPTGTISIIAGCSSGIEPIFAVAFMRNQAGALMPDVNPDFVARAKAEGWYSETLMHRIATEGHIHFPEVPAAVQAVFVTAHDVTPTQHVEIQAAWQMFVDSAISKTTNFPAHATPEDVRAVYLQAYASGCKGVTVYRDGSRDGQVLSTGSTSAPSAAPAAPAAPTGDGAGEAATLRGRVKELEAKLRGLEAALASAPDTAVAVPAVQHGVQRRPRRLRGYTESIETMFGTMYATLNVDEQGRLFEVFVRLGSSGGAIMADVEAMGRLASLALRVGARPEDVHKQLRGISSDKAYGFGERKVLSVPDAMGQVIEGWMRDQAGVQQELPLPQPSGGGAGSSYQDRDLLFMTESCPSCQSVGTVEIAEGCMKCHACGASQCG